jgi:transcription elongation factor
MAVSSAFVDSLRAALKKVPAPRQYDEFVKRLNDIKPAREAPAIKSSPENNRRIGRAAGRKA